MKTVGVMEKAILSREAVVKSAVKRYLGNDYSEWVDDAVQDVLCKALERASSYSSKMGSLDSWLYTISRNYCFDLMEKRSNNLKMRVELDDIDGLIDTPSFCEEFKKDRKLMRKALRRLHSKERLILTLKFYFDYSGKEIAQLMDLPMKHVAVHLQRAKDRLKRIIVSNPEYRELI